MSASCRHQVIIQALRRLDSLTVRLPNKSAAFRDAILDEAQFMLLRSPHPCSLLLQGPQAWQRDSLHALPILLSTPWLEHVHTLALFQPDKIQHINSPLLQQFYVPCSIATHLQQLLSIGVLSRVLSQQHCCGCLPHMRGQGIRLGVHSNGVNVMHLACSDDAHSNLATVGNQHLGSGRLEASIVCGKGKMGQNGEGGLTCRGCEALSREAGGGRVTSR